MSSIMTFVMLMLNVCWCLSLIEANQFPFEVLLKENTQDLKWDENYANEKNEKFQNLANKVRSKLGILFRNATDITEIQVKKFREGSVYAEFTVSLTNNTNITQSYFTTALNNTNSSLDIYSSQPPRTIAADIELTSFVWKENYAISSSCDFSTVTKEIKESLFNIYKSVPGLIDLEMLDLKKAGDEKGNVEFKMLLDSASDVKVEDLEQMVKSNKGKSLTGNMQFGEVSMKEVTIASDTDDGRKPSWVLILVAFSCLAIFALIVYFVYRVIAQSFAQPKFKLANND
ncbi:uncharacterized protein LOC116299376 isoform X2 [Actinia tenebrosa]|uniref:Uncharacterized protein LOC116299376 isoform X2 n=1 Tax=Actinia tenebrosa TaxID=6105 RepID=A0A6P8ID35_ACTTE|nr:uncharacterized protein LOC116299376 isoform X2 [Actinia tenebrosa]